MGWGRATGSRRVWNGGRPDRGAGRWGGKEGETVVKFVCSLSLVSLRVPPCSEKKMFEPCRKRRYIAPEQKLVFSRSSETCRLS
jgi:hypothetical protein